MLSLLELADPTLEEFLSPQPNEAYRYLKQGLDEYMYNDHNSALIAFNKAIELNPKYESSLSKNSIYYHCRGRVKEESGSMEDAILDYDLAIQIDPDCSKIYFDRGYAKAQIGNNTGALADYTSCIDKGYNGEVGYSFRGNVKQKLGDYAGAVADFHKALMIELRNTVDYILEFVDIKKPDKIIKEFSEIIDRTPLWAETEFGAEVYFYRGKAKFDLENFEEAIQDYDMSIQLNPNYADAYLKRGNAKYKLRSYSEAIQNYDLAIQLGCDCTEAYGNRGNAKYELNDYLGALKDYDLVIQIDPNMALAYFFRGNTKRKLKDYAGAVLDYDLAIQLDPKYHNVLYPCYERVEAVSDLHKAIIDFDKALMLELRDDIDMLLDCAEEKKLDELSNEFTAIINKIPLWAEAELGAEVYFYRGRAKFLQDDIAGALENFENSINLCPEGASSYNARGALYIEQGLNIKALNDLNTAISLCDEEADFYYNRAIAKFALGLKDSAYDDLRKAEELGMENVFDFDDEEDLEPII